MRQSGVFSAIYVVLSSSAHSPSPKLRMHVSMPKASLFPHFPSIIAFLKQLARDVLVKRRKLKRVAGIDQEELLDPEKLADADSLFMEINGVRIHHKTCHHETPAEVKEDAFLLRGNGVASVGLPMILLHGFGASVFSWNRVMPPLARISGSTVLAFDRPAFGLTSRIGCIENSASLNPYTTAFSTLATLSFIDKLGARKAILVGHSAGCLVTLNTYFESPERVAALILVAPAILAPFYISKAVKHGELRNKNKREGYSDLAVAKNHFSRFWIGLGNLFVLIAVLVLKMTQEMAHMVVSIYIKVVASLLRSAVSIMLVRVLIDKFGILAIQKSFYDANRVTRQVIGGYTKPLQAKGWERALLEYMIALLKGFILKSKSPISRSLGEITCPVVVITGDTDRIVPAWNARSMPKINYDFTLYCDK
ncbi:hypothetical protein HPP92_018431 [Vanilla planifolia]|uniref:AB hydrolase-1 domain-containing protein n=1 Tax=Vanilla planifolia TaxID=51239 RepID=A0A835UPH6_VANPL|nr:hypothetical protein HPP92_018431 [Vanilla planifolia]